MIRTVTLGTGLDHEVHVDEIAPGEVWRVLWWLTRAAGKGLNVARLATALGSPAHADSLVRADDEDRFRQAR